MKSSIIESRNPFQPIFMNIKRLFALIVLVFVFCLNNSVFSTHIEGGTLTYVRLGPGSLPNSSRYRIKLTLYRDPIGINLPGQIYIYCRADVTLPMNPSLKSGGISNMYSRNWENAFIRDFEIINRSAQDTLTVINGALTRNLPTSSPLIPTSFGPNMNTPITTTGFFSKFATVPGYEFSTININSYPADNMIANGFGFRRTYNLSDNTDNVNTCTSSISRTIQVGEYIRVVDLPNVPGGYHLWIEDYARNNAIANIINPGASGFAISTRIPDLAAFDNDPDSWKSLNDAYISAGLTTSLGIGVVSTGLGLYSLSNYNSLPSTSIIRRMNNSSPNFTSNPPIFLCQTSPVDYIEQNLPNVPNSSNSAIDLDGDILEYFIDSPKQVESDNTLPSFVGGGNYSTTLVGLVGDNGERGRSTKEFPFIDNWRNVTTTINGTEFNNGDMLFPTMPYGSSNSYPKNINIATFNRVYFRNNYTPENPLGVLIVPTVSGSLTLPGLSINSLTGFTTFLPPKTGNPNDRLVSNVVIREYRVVNGEKFLIGEIGRDFQFTVFNCPQAAQARGLAPTAGCFRPRVSPVPFNFINPDPSSIDNPDNIYWDAGIDRYTVLGVNDFRRINATTNTIMASGSPSPSSINYVRTILNATMTFPGVGTYWVKQVVQLNYPKDGSGKDIFTLNPQRTGCSDSVFVPVHVAIVSSGFTMTNLNSGVQLNTSSGICLGEIVQFRSDLADVSSTNTTLGIATTSGASLYTSLITNPYPREMVGTVVGNVLWMQADGSRTRTNPPPPEVSQIQYARYDFGNGIIQEMTLVGGNWRPLPLTASNTMQANTTFVGVSSVDGGRITLPILNHRYSSSQNNVNTSLYIRNQYTCEDIRSRSFRVIRDNPVATLVTQDRCQNNPTFSLVGNVSGVSNATFTGGSGLFVNRTFSSLSSPATITSNYFPTSSETVTGSIIPIKLNALGLSPCPIAISTSVGIVVTPQPVVSIIGVNQRVVLCRNNLKFVLNGTVTGGASVGIWTRVAGGGNSTSTTPFGTFRDPNTNALIPNSDATTTLPGGIMYDFSASDSLHGRVVLRLTSIDNGNCLPVSQTVVLTVGPAFQTPRANAGLDIKVCANKPQVTISGTVTNSGLGGIWASSSSSLTGFSSITTSTISGNQAFRITAVYTPSSIDTSNRSVNLFLTTNVNPSTLCVNVADTLKVNIRNSPQIFSSIGSTKGITSSDACANNANYTISGTVTGAGGFNLNIGTGNLSLLSSVTGTLLGDSFYAARYLYVPSASEIASASVGTNGVFFNFVSTFNGLCDGVSTPSFLTISPPPKVVISVVGGIVTTVSGIKTIELCKNNTGLNLLAVRNILNTNFIQWSGGSFSPSIGSQNVNYVSSSTDTLAGTARVILTGNRTDGCLPVYDTLNIRYFNPPVISVGSDQVICQNNLFAPLNGSVSLPATGGVWGSNGTGVFQSTNLSSSTSLIDTYNISATDYSNSSVLLSLTTTGAKIGSSSGQCLPTSKSFNVTFSDVPLITFGDIPQVNENNPNLTLTVTISGSNVTPSTRAIWTGGTGTYSPNNNTFNYISTSPIGPILTGTVNYTPSNAEIAARVANIIVSVSGASNCNPNTQTIAVNIFPSPRVTINNKGFGVCANNSTINLTASITGATGGNWSGGDNIVSQNATGTSATYIPSTNEINRGYVVLNLTSYGEFYNALPVQDVITVNIAAPPTARTLNSVSLCLNANSISIPGTITGALGFVWSTTGSGTFNLTTSVLGTNAQVIYSPSALDKTSATPIRLFLLSRANGACSEVFDVANLNFSPSPTANAGGDRVVCVNDFPVQLNASGNPGSWSSSRAGGIFGTTLTTVSSTLVDTYRPTTTTGVITLTWTTTPTTGCPSVSNSMNLTVLSAPTANIGPNITICGNSRTVLLTSTVTGMASGNWFTNGSGNFVSTATQIGNGLTDTYTISNNDVLNGRVTITFIGTGSSPCSPVSATKTIFITPELLADANIDQEFCSDIDVITLSGRILSNGLASSFGGSWSKLSSVTGSFLGSNLNNTVVFRPSFSDKNSISKSITLFFTPTVSGSCSGVVSDAVTYTFRTAPIVSILGSSFEVCSDVASIPLNATVIGANGLIWSTNGSNLISSWSVSNTNSSVNYVPTASDRLRNSLQFVISSNGGPGVCSNTISNLFTVSITGKPIVTLGTVTSVCINQPSVSLVGSNMTLTGSRLPSIAWGTSNPTGLSGSFNTPTTITTNNVGVIPVYSFSNNDIANGQVTLFLTVSGAGSCGLTQYSKTITLTPAPSANVGVTNENYCSNISLLTLTGRVSVSNNGFWTVSAPGTGVFAFNGTTAGFTPSIASRTLSGLNFIFTTTFSGCLPVSATKRIDLTPAPVVSITSVLTFCGDVITIPARGMVSTGSSYWSISPSASIISINNGPNVTTPSSVVIPTSSDIINAYTNNVPFKLSLISGNNGTCLAATVTSDIVFRPIPKIDGLSNKLLCSDVSNIPYSLTTTGVNALRWFTSANNTTLSGAAGTFTGTNSITSTLLNETYIPGSIERTGSTVLNVISTSVTNGCQNISISGVINYQRAPSLNALSDITRCINRQSVQLTAVGQNFASISWSSNVLPVNRFVPSNSTVTSYVLSNNDLLSSPVTITASVVGDGACLSSNTSRAFRLFVTPAPSLSVTTPVNICADVTTVQFASTISPSSFGVNWSRSSSVATSAGAFFPNRISNNPVYQFTQSELSSNFIKFVVTTTGNGDCIPVSDTVQVNIFPKPTITVPSSYLICSDEDFQSLTMTFRGSNFSEAKWFHNGSGNFGIPPIDQIYMYDSVRYTKGSSDDLLKSITFLARSVDQNSLCKAVESSFTVTLVSPPVINAGLDNTLCENVGVLTLSGTVSGNEAYRAQWLGLYGNQGTGSFTGSNIGEGTMSGLYFGGINTIGTNFNLGDGYENKLVFKLNITNTGICANQYSDTVTYKIQKLTVPVITSGDFSVCEDQSRFDVYATSRIDTTFALSPYWTARNPVSVAGISQYEPDQFTPFTIVSDKMETKLRYLISSSDFAQKRISFTMSIVGASICPIASVSNNVTIVSAPIVSVTGHPSACRNSPVITVTGYSSTGSGTWSSNTFGPNKGFFIRTVTVSGNVLGVYSISGFEFDNKLVSLVFSSTGNGLCKPVSSALSIELIDPPTVDAGADGTVCNLNVLSLLGVVDPVVSTASGFAFSRWVVVSTTGSSMVGTLSGSNISSINTISGVDIVSNTINPFSGSIGTGNFTFRLENSVLGCALVSDIVNIISTSSTGINAGTNFTICGSDQIQLNPSPSSDKGVWTTTGNGFFQSTGTKFSSKMNDIYFPASGETGSVKFILTTSTGTLGNCVSPALSSSTVTGFLTPGITVNAGASQFISICFNYEPPLLGTITGTTRAIWKTTGTGIFESISATGIVTNTGNVLTASGAGPIYTFADKYIPSENEKVEGSKIVLSLESLPDGITSCKTMKRDTLIVDFTRPPFADAVENTFKCANTALADGIELVGKVTMPSPNSNDLSDLPDNSARWIILTTDGYASALTSPGVFLSSRVKGDASSTVAGLGQYTTVSVTGVRSYKFDANDKYFPSIQDTITRTLNPEYRKLVLALVTDNVNITFAGINTVTSKNVKCNQVIAKVEVSFFPSPGAQILGSSILGICADQESIDLKGQIDRALGGVWSTTGGGQISASTTDRNITYNLSEAEKQTSTVTNVLFNLATTNNKSCLPVVSNVLTVTINPKPEIQVPSDQIVCADLKTISLVGFNVKTTTGSLPTSYQWEGFGGTGTYTGLGLNTVGITVGRFEMPLTYSFNENDASFGRLRYKLNTSGPNSCKPVDKIVNVDINPRPLIVPQPVSQICNDVSLLNLNVSLTNVSTVQWVVWRVNKLTSLIEINPTPGVLSINGISSSNGTLIGNNFNSVRYLTSASDRSDASALIFEVTSKGYLPTPSNPSCEEVKSFIRVNLEDRPTLTLNISDAQICSDKDFVNLGGTITGSNGATWSSSNGFGSFKLNNVVTSSDLLSNIYKYELNARDRDNTSISITLTADRSATTCENTYSITSVIGVSKIPILSAGLNDSTCVVSNIISFSTSTQTGAVGVRWIPVNGSGTVQYIGSGSPLTDNDPRNFQYSISGSDLALGAVTFKLESTGGPVPCNPVESFRTVVFKSAPTLNLFSGLSQEFCSDVNVIQLVSNAKGANNLGWTSYKYPSSLTGTNQVFFPSSFTGVRRGVFRSLNDSTAAVNNTFENGYYFVGREDTLGTNFANSHQIVSLVLTVNGSGACSSNIFTSEAKVKLTERPSISILPISDICLNDNVPITIIGIFNNTVASSAIWSSTGNGNYSPSVSFLNPPSVAGVVYAYTPQDKAQGKVTFSFSPVDSKNGCKSPLIEPKAELRFINGPTISIGADLRVCDQQSVVSIPSSVVTGISRTQWRSSGTGSFTSNTSNPGADKAVTSIGARVTTSDVYVPSISDKAAGEVVLLVKATVMDNGCPSDSARLKLKFDKTPELKVGLDRTICSDDNFVTISGSVLNHVYASWQSLPNTSTGVIAGSGVFIPSNTISGTKDVVYEVSNKDVGLDVLQFYLTSADPNSQCPSITQGPLSIFINKAPVANSGSASVCTPTGIHLNGSSQNGVTEYWKILNNSGTGRFSPSQFSRNAVYVPSDNDLDSKREVTLGFIVGGKTSCDTSVSILKLQLDRNPLPIANAGTDEIVCLNESFVLNAQDFNLGNSYKWYAKTIGGAYGIINETRFIDPVTSTLGITYTRSKDVFISKDTLFILQVVKGSNMCIANDTIKIKVLTLPALNLTPNVCFSDTLVLPFNQSPPITKTDGKYQWYRNNLILGGETSKDRLKVPYTEDITTYVLEYTEFRCSIYDTTTVRPLPKLRTLGRVICRGSEILLTPTIIPINNIDPNSYRVNWGLGYNETFNGFNINVPAVDFNNNFVRRSYLTTESRDSSKFLVEVTDQAFGLSCISYDTIRVKTHPIPDMNLRDIGVCDNEIVNLDATPLNLVNPIYFKYPPSTLVTTITAAYAWSSNPVKFVIDTITRPIASINKDIGDGRYIATFTMGECIKMDTSNVTFSARPIVDNYSIVDYCVDSKQGVVLDAGGRPSDNFQYYWLLTGSSDKTVTVYDTASYYVRITTPKGCSILDTINVRSACEPSIFMPEVLLPGQPANASLFLNGKYFKNIKFTVYNRWGEPIFYTEKDDFVWNATIGSSGTTLPTGVYPYRLEYEGRDDKYKGKKYTKLGGISVIH